jgi:hypothetical protein
MSTVRALKFSGTSKLRVYRPWRVGGAPGLKWYVGPAVVADDFIVKMFQTLSLDILTDEQRKVTFVNQTI